MIGHDDLMSPLKAYWQFSGSKCYHFIDLPGFYADYEHRVDALYINIIQLHPQYPDKPRFIRIFDLKISSHPHHDE
jgi:hypothetical protein